MKDNMIITTTPTIEEYIIIEYLGIVTAEMSSNSGGHEAAIDLLKREAKTKKADAIVGVSCSAISESYGTIKEGMHGSRGEISSNRAYIYTGTAVKIEKIK